MSTFSERLKELRTDAGLKQSEVACAIGVSIQSYSSYENGREPKYDTLKAIGEFFHVTTDYLIGSSPFKSKDISGRTSLTTLDDNLKKINSNNRKYIIASLNNFLIELIEAKNLDYYKEKETLFIDYIGDMLSEALDFLEMTVKLQNQLNVEDSTSVVIPPQCLISIYEILRSRKTIDSVHHRLYMDILNLLNKSCNINIDFDFSK